MTRDIIAIGGSAGSLDTLRAIAAALPPGFSGNAFIVVHIGHGRSRLPELLAVNGNLPARFARDGEPMKPGHIYVAPADRHLIVEPGRIRLSRGPREHFTRPAIDPLFRSVAGVYRERVIGVVLSGGGSDGAAGLDTIKRAGGLAVILDPHDAASADMPQAAAEIVHPDYVARSDEIPSLLVRLLHEPAPEPRGLPGEPPEPIQMPEPPLALTCPECGGALRQLGSGPTAQFRCHTGHIFGAREFPPAQLEMLEKAFDVARRVLNERVELARQMAEDARVGGRTYGLSYWQRVQAETEQQAEAIRQFLTEAVEAEHELQEAGE